jgi:hypothetical protein
MDDRVASLEKRLEELERAVRRIELRLDSGESESPAEAEAEVRLPALPAETGRPSAPARERDALLARAVALTGRSFLVLGGAYLFRALTDSGTLTPSAGVAAGLAYALVWVVLAGLSARGGHPLSAAFHGVLSAGICFPLLFDATARLKVFSPEASATALVVLAALLVGVAWKGEIRVMAWSAVLGSVGSALALMPATRRLEPFTAALLAIGAGTIWLTYGRRWHGLRWPAAFAADAGVAVLVVLAGWTGGPPEGYRGLSAGWAVALALGLFIVYPGSFIARTVLRHRSVTVFETVQTLAALVVGFGGAVRVARATGIGSAGLGAAAIALSVCCYGAAFAFAEKRPEWGRNFLFFTTLALVLAVSGGALAVGDAAVPFYYAAFGVAAAAFAAAFRRTTLAVHASAYEAAAFAFGLLGPALDAFFGDASAKWRIASPSAFVVLGAAVLAYGWLGVGWRRVAAPGAGWLPRAMLVALIVLGAGSILIETVRHQALLGDPRNPGVTAAIRSVVLAAGAVVLALVYRRSRLTELRGAAQALLILGGLKLLLRDVATGRPVTLFPTFLAYGAALLLTPRLLRGGADRDAASPLQPDQGETDR